MNKSYALPIAAVLLLLVAFPLRAQDKISVMTQNQYLGADLSPILAAPGPLALNNAVLDALAQAASNDFPLRVGLLAQKIANRRPHLVGLQEVVSLGCIDLFSPLPGQGCDDPSIAGAFNDHLSLTMDALTALGETYVVGASVRNVDLLIPVGTGFSFLPDILVTVTDHDVILARGDVASSVVPVPYSGFCTRPSADGGPGCNYIVVAEAETPVGPIAVERGWVGVDVAVGGRDYRFVNTHLEIMEPDPTEPLSPFIQAAQAAELIAVLDASTPLERSLIVVGDINSSPDDPVIPGPFPLPPPFDTAIFPPYVQFVDAGYTDAWTLRPRDASGPTCCQFADLSNVRSVLDERIDMIFSADIPAQVKRARVLGDGIREKSSIFGLWPSDHGQVAAKLLFD
jgi:hypothetical protein